MPVNDIFDNAFDIKNAAIKDFWIIGGVTAVAPIIAIIVGVFVLLGAAAFVVNRQKK